MKYYVADFETTDVEPVHIWLWAIVEMNTDNVITGVGIKDFISTVFNSKHNHAVIYFHNLKFDGNFISYYILSERKDIELDSLIGGQGQWYSLTLKKGNINVTFQDSLKLIPSKVKDIPKAFGLKDIEKLDIEYSREDYSIVTELDLEYIKHDVIIVSQALSYIHEIAGKKMTAGANALAWYKAQLYTDFRTLYPLLDEEIDSFCRKSYRGGYVYLNPIYANTVIYNGDVYDVNSMYPWAMSEKPLPYDVPKYCASYEELTNSKTHPLFIIHFYADFSLKSDHLPTIQNKKNPFFGMRDYIVDSHGMYELTLTSVDYDMFQKNYDVWNESFIDGYMFRSTTAMFSDYVSHWMNIKNTSTGAMRTIAKLMMNSLYGKFGKNPLIHQNKVELDDVIKVSRIDDEHSESVYIPVATFITAYCRERIISNAESVLNNFIYCDTDSIHMIHQDNPQLLIDEKKLGYFKHESHFERGRFIHPKCYIEEIQGKLHPVASGLPQTKEILDQITFDNFIPGATYDGKLQFKSVKGGALLVGTTFTIKG
jgi:hypothetical protein